MHYVYLLIDPRDNKPFYVGKGKGDRITAHEKEARAGKASAKCIRIRQIWAADLAVRRVFDSEHTDERSAYAREQELIKAHVCLTNITHNDGKPIVYSLNDMIFRAAFAPFGIERAKIFAKMITVFPWEEMDCEFRKRMWMTGAQVCKQFTPELLELERQGML